ncbi:MAG: LysR family transcriptional regulator, partial [Pseudomonadota bacterium]
MSRQPSLSALQAFAAVMRHGTVTEAARRLHIAQPALSRLVAQCEESLGVKLFKRQRKRLFPTEVAEQILPDIERLLASHAELPFLATGLESGSGSIFRIAAAPRLADGLVGCAVQRMQSRGYT